MKKELLRELLETKQYKQLHVLLMKESEVDIAYLLQQLELEECAIAFRLLSKKQAARVFSNMEIQRQKQLVELFSETELIALVENQYMDDLVDLVEDLPANLVTRILNHASASQRQIINQLLSYPSESAGALMTTEFLSLKKEMTILEALNTDLVCDAINTAMRELFLQIVYGRSQSAFSEGGLTVGAGLEDLGKGHRSQVGTIYSTKVKGPRYLELAEGYIVEIGLDENDTIIGYKYVNLGKMMDNIKAKMDPMQAIEEASGTYGRFEEAVKKIDPREE